MNGQNDENLKELFERFGDKESAGQAAGDIQAGERILREHPAPEPGAELISDIKVKIDQALERRKRDAFRRGVYKAVAVAAVFIVLASISKKVFEKDKVENEKGVFYASVIPTAIWESDNIAADDSDLASLIAEFQQLEEDVVAVQLGENRGNVEDVAAELEIELLEMNGDFWKG